MVEYSQNYGDNPKPLNLPAIILSVFAIVVLVLGGYAILSTMAPKYNKEYDQKLASGEISNPILGNNQGPASSPAQPENIPASPGGEPQQIVPAPGEQPAQPEESLTPAEEGQNIPSEEEIPAEEENITPVNISDEDKINLTRYVLVEMKAYNLHPPALSSDLPKIELWIDEDIYGVTIDEGEIAITAGEMAEKDIIISTIWQEMQAMSLNASYISESFSSGASVVEPVASETTLFLKGYSELGIGL